MYSTYKARFLPELSTWFCTGSELTYIYPWCIWIARLRPLRRPGTVGPLVSLRVVVGYVRARILYRIRARQSAGAGIAALLVTLAVAVTLAVVGAGGAGAAPQLGAGARLAVVAADSPGRK